MGIVKEKEQARNEYDDAIASGHGAYFLEQQSDTVFSASIGNLPPKKQVLVSVVYQHELDFTATGQLRIVLPNQKLPPDGSVVPNFPAPISAAPELEAKVPNGLTIELEFEMTSTIVAIESPSHQQIQSTLDPDGHKATVKLPTSPKPLVEDLEILCKLSDPSACVEKKQYFFFLLLVWSYEFVLFSFYLHQLVRSRTKGFARGTSGPSVLLPGA